MLTRSRASAGKQIADVHQLGDASGNTSKEMKFPTLCVNLFHDEIGAFYDANRNPPGYYVTSVCKGHNDAPADADVLTLNGFAKTSSGRFFETSNICGEYYCHLFMLFLHRCNINACRVYVTAQNVHSIDNFGWEEMDIGENGAMPWVPTYNYLLPGKIRESGWIV